MENNEEKLNITNEDVKEEVTDKEDVKEDKSSYVMPLPEEEKENSKILEPNKRAFWSMRIASFIIDVCLIFLATYGFKFLFDNTGISNGAKDNYYHMWSVADHLKLDDTVTEGEVYALKIYEDNEIYNEPAYKNYLVYPLDNDTDPRYKIIDMDKIDNTYVISDALKQRYVKALSENNLYKNYSFNYKLIDYGLVMFAAGLSTIVFLIIVPLLNKRRATLGKLFAGIQVINSKYIVEAKWYQIVGRAIFIYLFEMALPQLFLGNAIYTILTSSALIALTTVLTKSKRSLNDLISRVEPIVKTTFVPLDEQ